MSACVKLQAVAADARFYAHYPIAIPDDCEGRLVGEDGETVVGHGRLDTKELVGADFVPVKCILLLV